MGLVSCRFQASASKFGGASAEPGDQSLQIDENIKPTQSETADFFVNAFICPQYYENESTIFIKGATCHEQCRFWLQRQFMRKNLNTVQDKRWLLNYKCIVCNLRKANISLHHVHGGLGRTGKQRRQWNFTSESDDASAPRKKPTNVNNPDKVNRIVFTDTNATEFI